MEDAHRCSAQVEGRLRQAFPQVAHFLVHTEPT
jgi:divalent metal cation (Fe/Co/Zn/Cd) transporter